jgi:hypothetical protein
MNPPHLCGPADGSALALWRAITRTEAHTMVWFFERESELLICEIRLSAAGDTYEFEVAPSDGAVETRQYRSPRALIDGYLSTQRSLKTQGWTPRMNDVQGLD